MNIENLLNSGDLELYVYGILNESETNQIAQISSTDSAIKTEIIAIENSIINLSSSFSPVISADVYEKIKQKLFLKNRDVIKMKPKNNWPQYMGWAAAVLVMIGAGYQYTQLSETKNSVAIVEKEKTNLQETVIDLRLKNKESLTALTVVRDTKNTVINLAGQAVSPKSYSKIYWNKETEVVYVDATGLPEPPDGMVYQIWSLKLLPQLTPTSIGLLTDFNSNNQKLFKVSKTGDAEAFGITLEPAGGSKSPTMEQLYTLGKV
ncbi:anti-sigma factor [Flavobacterium sp.]|uniref:anti-sigma factor n=1 Tax=Flavobacterium sp. TaxID=239 RepID=UPI00286A24D5|nr:anti-sigma factor [Flavobacterium sp.]